MHDNLKTCICDNLEQHDHFIGESSGQSIIQSEEEAFGSGVTIAGMPSTIEPFSRQIETMVSYPCKGKVPQVKAWNSLTKKVPHIPGTQFGLLSGKTNDFLVVDCDLLKNNDPKCFVDGLYAWNEWMKKHGDVCAPRVKTVSGGLHVYFCFDAEVSGSNQQLDGCLVSAEHAGKKIKIDVLTNEKNVIAPGSPGYEFLTEEDKQRPLVPLPDWLKEILLTSKQHAKKREFQKTNASQTPQIHKKQKLQEEHSLRKSSSNQKNEQQQNNPMQVSKHTLQAKVEELDASHAESYETWTRVLWAICNTACENNYDALDIAVAFSKKCPSKFRVVEDVRKVYEQANSRNYDRLGYRYIVSLAGRNPDSRSSCLRLLCERLAQTSGSSIFPINSIVSVDAIDRVFDEGSLLVIKYTDNQGAQTILTVNTPYAALYDKHNKFLCFLADKLELENSLGFIDAAFDCRCTCHFLNEKQFEIRAENACLTLVNPMKRNLRYMKVEIPATNSADNDLLRNNSAENSNLTEKKVIFVKRKSNLVVEAVQNAALQFLQETLHLNFRINADLGFEGNSESKNSEEQQQYEIIEELISRKDNLREIFRYVGKNGMYVCDEKTKIWKLLPDCVVDDKLTELLKKMSLENKNYLNKGYITGLRSYFCARMYDDRFEHRLLDSKTSVFAFDNGTVLDLERNEFRETRWDDYVSLTCGWNYDYELSKNYADEVRRFFLQVLPIEKERKFCLEFFANLLSGCKDTKLFLVFTDKRAGNNGKSTLVVLMQQLFGEYAASGLKNIIKSSFVNDKNSHDSAILALNKKRLLVCDELKHSHELDCSFIKAVTGGSFRARGRQLYSREQEQFTWTAGIVTVNNEHDFPKFDTNDTAFTNRMVVLPFRSKFLFDEVQVLEESERHTFLADVNLKHNFPLWLSALLDLLREHIPKEPLENHVPDSMKDWRNAMCTESDEVGQWLEERISVTKIPEHFLTQEEVFQRMKLFGIRCTRNSLTPKWKAFAKRFELEYREQFLDNQKNLRKVVMGVYLNN